jgi:hypothetical protein
MLRTQWAQRIGLGRIQLYSLAGITANEFVHLPGVMENPQYVKTSVSCLFLFCVTVAARLTTQIGKFDTMLHLLDWVVP